MPQAFIASRAHMHQRAVFLCHNVCTPAAVVRRAQVSGKVWKAPSLRASLTNKPRVHTGTWEQKMAAKAAHQAFAGQKREAQQAARDKRKV
jgi:hypothetical protein